MSQEERTNSGAPISRRDFNRAAVIAAAPVILGATTGEALAASDKKTNGKSSVDAALYSRCVEQAARYLTTVGQAEDGSYSGKSGIGVTTIAATALLSNGWKPEDPAVAKSLKLIESCVQPDGGVYTPGGLYANYETCLAIMCFVAANERRYDKIIQNAEAFVKKEQWGSPENVKEPSDLSYGGAGYGKHQRPDLSNTAFLTDALRAAGNCPDDPAIQRALVFVSRCQNFESENNTNMQAALNPDGGFFYTCAAGGNSPAGDTLEGGLRSYGSMTYSGLKSFIHAGLKADDPRVKAATRWIRANYDLESNPGLGDSGLFYFYHVFAKTMGALGETFFADASGAKHDWRAELVETLAKRQGADGSWVNSNRRWMEGDPNLVTSYALLAMHYCRPAV